MMVALLLAAVIWGGCTAVVIGAVLLSRVIPPVGTLLFEAPPPTRARLRVPGR